MKITNNHNLPGPLYATIKWAIEKYEGPRAKAVLNRHISVTTLVNPPRLTLLRAWHEDDLEVDASELLYMVSGIAFHYMMGEISWSEQTENIIEKRIERSHNGWLITGQFDVLTVTAPYIADWKWTSVWSILRPKFEWAAQLNLYRWLAKAHGYDIDVLKTWAMLRDWSATKAKIEPGLPPIAFAEVEQQAWDSAVTEAYINDRLSLYDHSLSLVQTSGNPNAGPVCTQEERWNRKGVDVRCRQYCDVARFCAFGSALPAIAPSPEKKRRSR